MQCPPKWEIRTYPRGAGTAEKTVNVGFGGGINGDARGRARGQIGLGGDVNFVGVGRGVNGVGINWVGN